MAIARRRFLQSAAAGIAAGASGLPGSLLARDVDAGAARSLPALGRGLKGRLLLPDDPAYAFAAMPNNARYSGTRPMAIARCVEPGDVQACLAWARDNNQRFAIRSGGHNYAGFSTTDGLLIDLKGLNGASLDMNEGTATLQGGVNNEGSASALRTVPFAIPSGRCPTVGVGGLVLGGGWGFGATKSGLTCDSLISTEVILADGRRVTASETENPDLFWACRGGGGGNFGVHTSFKFMLRPVTDVVTFHIVWKPGRQVELMSLLQSLQIDNAPMISSRFKAVPTGRGALPGIETLAVQTLGLFWGTESQLRELLAPALAMQPTLMSEINTLRYWSARDYLVTDDPTGFYDLRSQYVANRLDDTALETMLRWMSKWPGGSQHQANMGILFAMGGAVKNKRPDETAYFHRANNFLFEMEASWGPLDAPETVARQRAWLGDYVADMQRFLLPSAYVNFPSLELRNWQKAYYGDNLKRLSEVKRRYDPDNVFRFEQSIPLSA